MTDKVYTHAYFWFWFCWLIMQCGPVTKRLTSSDILTINTPWLILVHLPLGKMAVISQTAFSDAFYEWKCLNFGYKLTEICFQWSNWKYVCIGLGNGLAPNRRHAITLNQCWPSSLTHMCVTRRRWVNEVPKYSQWALYNWLWHGQFPAKLHAIDNSGGFMMTSSNRNIFRVTGPLWGEFTGHRWIPRTQRPVTRSFAVFFDLRLNIRLSKQSWGWWYEMPSHLLWRHCNPIFSQFFLHCPNTVYRMYITFTFDRITAAQLRWRPPNKNVIQRI